MPIEKPVLSSFQIKVSRNTAMTTSSFWLETLYFDQNGNKIYALDIQGSMNIKTTNNGVPYFNDDFRIWVKEVLNPPPLYTKDLLNSNNLKMIVTVTTTDNKTFTTEADITQVTHDCILNKS